MDRTVLTLVDPVSTTPNVTMSPVPVYRGVVLGTREISVLKVFNNVKTYYSICLCLKSSYNFSQNL